MTEDEAKAKWCPAFRGNDHGINRPLDLDSDAKIGRCIVTACMAWRGLPQRAMVQDPSAKPARIFETDTPTAYEKTGRWNVERMPHEGFCGLAGVPTR